MRLVQDLNLPDDLEHARRTGDLVIFAGAGVSMGAPSLLPSFEGLARDIAEPNLRWTPADSATLDRYLGKAESVGVDVQVRAREKLLARGGTHTSLHENLLRVFGIPKHVRLITTNFDTHFTAASAVVFPGLSLPHYVGPALPLGRDFHGIVQLHGSLADTHQPLVLTAHDFGEAYLTEGWATRFLARVFAQRTVLFVGYSLTDPVLQYLVLSLPHTQRWFALSPESESERWLTHSVRPVSFHESLGAGPFGDLNAGMARWGWYARASAVDHDNEMRHVGAQGPPLTAVDEDYVRAQLKTMEGRQSFWRSACTLNWFWWARDEGLLSSLTSAHGDDADVSFWARWALTHFAAGEQPPLLELFRRQGLSLHPQFALELALHLFRLEDFPPPAVLRQFIALLVNQKLLGEHGHDPFVYLLQKLIRKGCSEEAGALLGALTRINLGRLEQYYFALEGDANPNDVALPALSLRIALQVPADDLAWLLQSEGNALAALDAEKLLELGEHRIQEAYSTLDLARAENGTTDWLSYGITAIADSDQDTVPHAEHILVMLVRKALEHLRLSDPRALVSFSDKHSRSRRPLLRRLALHAIALSDFADSSSVLARTVSEGWPRDTWIRPELYHVLEVHFARAEEVARNAFVSSVRDDTWWGTPITHHQERTRFDLSRLLTRLSPESATVTAFAHSESQSHPDWTERDPDGYLSRVEIRWGSTEPSPIEAEQLLNMTPAEAVTEASRVLNDVTRTEEGHAILGAVQQAVAANAEWAVRAFLLSTSDTSVPHRLAEAILWGLRQGATDHSDQVRLLRALSKSGWPTAVNHALGMLIEFWSGKLGDATEPSDLLDALDGVADRLYDMSRTDAPAMEERGWTERALNHPAGNAAQVWWRVANARDRVDGQFVLSVDESERVRWARVIADESAAGAFARPILGMATERLSAGAHSLMQDTIFPAFNPAAGPERAAQLWDGRLSQSQWSWATLSGLMPVLPTFFASSASLVPARSEQLGDWVAMLVANMRESQFSLALLQLFIQHSTVSARQLFARKLPRHLERLSSDDRRRVWTEILHPYWNDRRTNVPAAISPEEAREMVRWVVALPEVAAEALNELNAYVGPVSPHADHLIHQWAEDPAWLRENPAAGVGILAFLSTRGAIQPWNVDETADLLETALECGATPSSVFAAAEPLIVFGSDKMRALIARAQA